MIVERSSLCNCVVNFLLEENYLLTAFELLHELLEDGRDDQAIRLKNFFSDPSHFPPDQLSRYHSLRVADPQILLQEKEAMEEKLAISEYELRLAQEGTVKFKSELQKIECNDIKSESCEVVSVKNGRQNQREARNFSFSNFGPLKDNERRDLNCAIKEYLLIACYKRTAMTFYEEVADQDLDVWQNSPACVPDALRHYYYEYLSSSSEAAEEKIAMLRENESFRKSNKLLSADNETLLKNKESADSQLGILTKSLEVQQKDLKEKEQQVQTLKQTLELQRKELNDCRSEITALKMHIEGSRLGFNALASDVDNVEFQSLERCKEEIKLLKSENENLKLKCNTAPGSVGYKNSINNTEQTEEKCVVIHEYKDVTADSMEILPGCLPKENSQLMVEETVSESDCKPEEAVKELSSMSKVNVAQENGEGMSGRIDEQKQEGIRVLPKSENLIVDADSEKGLGTIQILADALPKIVPYVLINHREQLLPLMMCAIERHPDTNTRDSLTHTLFNLIKRPDEQQRRVIMDACVTLAKNVGEMRTEMELLPQCWEQINHTFEERRLLVAQSCGELAGFVRPEIRDSVILSIVQQLIEDSARVVREAAARNLAILLPLFPNVDKYFKVEELMFQLVCDPSGAVVEVTLKELVPAVIKWGNKLDHVLRVLLSHILRSALRCQPLSGVEGSMESHFRVLGERERWNIDILLRMLTALLPSIYEKAIEACPFSPASGDLNSGLTTSVLQLYAGSHIEWGAFEWMHVECFPTLIQLACMLPQKEDNLRMRIVKFLLSASEHYGDSYLTHIMVPVFLVAVGDDADLKFFPSAIYSRIKGLRPRTAVASRISTMCALPLLLAGILGAPSKHKELEEYLRKLLQEFRRRKSLDDTKR